MTLGLVRPLFVLALLAATARDIQAQEVSAWFAGSPWAGPYASVREEAEKVAAELAATGVPDRLLADRLAEGAGKRVPPARLLAALREEAGRLAVVVRLLGTRGMLPLPPEDPGTMLAEGALLLRSGLPETVIEAALDAARTPGAKPPQSARRAFAAAAVLVSIGARFPLGETSSRSLAAAMAGSALRQDSFGSLVSIFTRGRALGLASEKIAEISSGVLAGGGSLDRVERELARRSKTP